MGDRAGGAQGVGGRGGVPGQGASHTPEQESISGSEQVTALGMKCAAFSANSGLVRYWQHHNVNCFVENQLCCLHSKDSPFPVG